MSCGTWALVGVELAAPVVSADARAANFTNEVGADGRIRFLRNVMGLWLLSESVRQWERDGSRVDLPLLLEQAAACPPPAEVFDADDPRFVEPGRHAGSHPRRGTAERGLPAPANRPEMARAIVESLAAGFARGVEQAAALSGVPVETVHLVGGGARNRLLCQLVADRVGRPVVAGPVEATAIGNVLIQARAHGLLRGDLDDLRGTMATTLATERFEPQRDPGRKGLTSMTNKMKTTATEPARPRAADAVQEAGVRRDEAQAGQGADHRGPAPHRQAPRPRGPRSTTPTARRRPNCPSRAPGRRSPTSSSIRPSCATCRR